MKEPICENCGEEAIEGVRECTQKEQMGLQPVGQRADGSCDGFELVFSDVVDQLSTSVPVVTCYNCGAEGDETGWRVIPDGRLTATESA